MSPRDVRFEWKRTDLRKNQRLRAKNEKTAEARFLIMALAQVVWPATFA